LTNLATRMIFEEKVSRRN